MELKDIHVHIDNSEQSAGRLAAAMALASAHDAHLTGVHARATPYLPVLDLSDFPADLLELQTAEVQKLADRTEVEFMTVLNFSAIEYDWISQEGQPLDVLVAQARFADLVVVSQSDPEGGGTGDLPGALALSAGRPVLVLPFAGHEGSLGKRVMVGWDGSPQAARAVNDALPFLAGAEEVDLVSVRPADGADPGRDSLDPLSQHLARHGIQAEAQTIQVDDVGIADMLLSRARDREIDLFVMGAYGHPRWRELVLGGVTAHMLEHMTMPVLMAH